MRKPAQQGSYCCPLTAHELGQVWGRGQHSHVVGVGWGCGPTLFWHLFECPYLHRSDSQGDSGTGTRQMLGLL